MIMWRVKAAGNILARPIAGAIFPSETTELHLELRSAIGTK